MPRDMRFCRNCGNRLGEGPAEYTPTEILPGSRPRTTGTTPFYASVNAPWAAPGAYTVRLTVGGKTFSQPLTLKLDPRVKTSAVALATLTSLTKEMYAGAKKLRDAAVEARAIAAELEKASGDVSTLKAEITALAPPAVAGGGTD